MSYLARLGKSPTTDGLSPEDISFINQHFDVSAQGVTLNGVTVPWDEVTGLEVATAARSNSPAGWFVKKLVYGGEARFHAAIYFGRNEAVLPNVSLKIVQHIVQTIAYYAPKRIPYTGVDGISPLAE